MKLHLHMFPIESLDMHSVQKFGLVKSVLRSPRLHLFDQKYSKNSNIVKYYYNLK